MWFTWADLSSILSRLIWSKPNNCCHCSMYRTVNDLSIDLRCRWSSQPMANQPASTTGTCTWCDRQPALPPPPALLDRPHRWRRSTGDRANPSGRISSTTASPVRSTSSNPAPLAVVNSTTTRNLSSKDSPSSRSIDFYWFFFNYFFLGFHMGFSWWLYVHNGVHNTKKYWYSTQDSYVDREFSMLIEW